ncbi:PSP1 domain-containing protein [Melioribacter sp. OK-6-Me]|uniref:PSP1 domain-containing protein n=1 Tax=unclassified Melioribacter TaxID=2627329 RepID=UPI003ED8B45A
MIYINRSLNLELNNTDKLSSSNGNIPFYQSIVISKFHASTYHSCFNCTREFSSHAPLDKRNIIEIDCDGLLNCEYCVVENGLQVYPYDFVIVKQNEDLEVAQVKAIGEIVRIKRSSAGLYGEDLPVVIRKMNDEDVQKLNRNLKDEEKAVGVFKNAVAQHNLEMKLVKIHYQFDRKKLYFFYTADGRIDFRELAKTLAAEFKTRIELRQIGVRDEAREIGGIGTCGREFCCTSFLNNFRKITTQLATEQNLMSSLGKLSGPCGKLKCCLSFEVE